jgi:hypothetical protein
MHINLPKEWSSFSVEAYAKGVSVVEHFHSTAARRPVYQQHEYEEAGRKENAHILKAYAKNTLTHTLSLSLSRMGGGGRLSDSFPIARHDKH